MTKASDERKGAFADRPGLARFVAVKRFLARIVMVSEQALPKLLVPLYIIAFYLSYAWFGLFRLSPDWLRWSVLTLFAIGFIISLWPLRRLRWPTAQEADRFLEERNGLPHQPVTVQQDALSQETPFARALWREHQTRMAARIAALDAGLPRPDIGRHDRFGLRAIPALIVAVAASFSLSNSGGTLGDAFTASSGGAHNPDLRVDAWVTPPYYTGQAPTYLTGNAKLAQNAISVPQFSDLTIRITGGQGDEKVTFQAAGADKPDDVAEQTARNDGKEDGQNQAAGAPKMPTPPSAASAQQGGNPVSASTHAMKLDKSGTLAVGDESWSLKVVADKPPEIAFDGIPRATVTGALEIAFKGKDDYGVDEAYAEIVPVETDPQAKPLYGLPEYKLEIAGRNRRDIKGLASHDLTQDPLAGKRVRVTLVAKDGAGQTGRSPPYEMTLPARNFSQPLAAAVAEERQVFALDTRKMPEAIALNEALTLRADETIPDLTNYLLIQSARSRMQLARSDADLKDTADYLWQIATGMEDGQLSDAQKRLRDAQQKLSDALQRNAPDSEIKKAMDELRKAMNDYMKELAQRMQNAPMQPNQKSANVLRQQDLQRMMDQIENLARSGNRDAAQQMLSELQNMMNNLQAGRPQNGQQQQGQQSSEAQKQMDKLGQILRDQQKLMDETFRLNQAMKDRMQRGDQNEDGDQPFDPNQPFNQPMPGQNGQMPQDQDDQDLQGQQEQQDQQGRPRPQGQEGQNGQSPDDGKTLDQLRDALKQLRERQDQLGKDLGQVQQGLGKLGVKPPSGFGQAQREMEGAAGNLGEGQGDPALQGQGRAMQALRQGARDMMNQMMQAMQQGGQQSGQQGQGQMGRGNQNGRDPLGRLRNDGNDSFSDNGPKIPDEIDVQRAREILDAIRQRLGNNPTQEEERHYLERLLDIQ